MERASLTFVNLFQFYLVSTSQYTGTVRPILFNILIHLFIKYQIQVTYFLELELNCNVALELHNDM